MVLSCTLFKMQYLDKKEWGRESRLVFFTYLIFMTDGFACVVLSGLQKIFPLLGKKMDKKEWHIKTAVRT